MRKVVAFCMFCFVASALCFAQSTTDGAIGGTIFDKSGAVVGNAKIVVHNNGTNAEQTVNADASGYYRVSGLQPGDYTVTITGGGLAPYKAEKVIVQVGSLTEVSPHLLVGGSQETVDVTTEAPQINYTSPEFAPVMDQTAISNLPINGGRWSNFSLLTPGVVSDSNAFGLLSFRGVSTLLNNNTVDGADNNQAFFSEERGRTRIGYSTPKEAVQEFQVNTSNYSAEYGRSAGGVVNTVTKSGTNDIHGDAYFYDRDNTWGAANPFTQIAVQTAPGVFTPENFKPTNWRKMAGFGAGGPLIKDRLFLFVAYDWYRNNFPGTSVASNPTVFFAPISSTNLTTFAQHLNGLPATGAGSTPTAAQLAAASTLYTNDLAALSTMLGPVPRTGDQNILFPKLDWVVNSRNHASFSFNRMRWTSPAGIQTQPTVTRGITSFGNDFVRETWGVAKLDTVITNNFANELRFQYGRDFEFEFSQSPAPYELANLVNTPTFTNPLGLPPSVTITNGFQFGVPTFLQRPAFPDEVRQQYADTMTWTHGKHTFKYGFDFSHVDDNSQNLSTQFGSYNYSNLVNYFSDLNVPHGCATSNTAIPSIPCYTNFSQSLGPQGFEFTTNDYALFAQDDWKILPRLSLSFGLRYEYEMAPHVFGNLVNPLVPQTGKMPADHNNFGPRVGFAWDLTGSGKTVLRGGYGIYYGRYINSTIFSALTNTGMPGGQNNFFFTPTTAGAPTFPKILSAGTVLGKPNITFFDPHFQNPQIHQMDLTLERQIGWGTVFSVSYLGSLGRELPDFVDTNICTSTSQVTTLASGAPGPNCNPLGTITYQVVNGGPLNTASYTTALFKQRLDARFGSETDVFSGINSSYHALVVQANHRMSRNIQFAASYTWSHAIDFGQNQTTFTGTNFLLFPNTIAPEKGNSIYDVPNRFVMNAIVTSPWKKTGVMGWFANGWEWSPIYQIQNGLPYTLSVTGNAPGGAVSGINGSGGTNRIDVLGNNSFRLPVPWLVDMRISKSFSFRERYKLELLADFFNIANKQNAMSANTNGYSISSTGTIATASGPVTCSAASPCLGFNTTGPTPTTGAPFAPVFGTTTSINNSNFLYTPRQIQLGARVHF